MSVDHKAKFQEWIRTQPKEIRDAFKEDPKAFRKRLLYQAALRKKLYPCHDFVPNVFQERGLECYRKKNPETNDYPAYLVVTGGNGSGKTCDMAILIVGCAYGKKYLHPDYYGDFEYFDDCEKIRRERPLAIRIICANADMEQNGSVYQQIKKWIPQAKFSGKSSSGYYTIITIPHPEKGFKTTVIDIKTHDMDLVKFSGSDCDLIIFNEPIKDEEKFDECVGRVRMGGRIAMFLTPLKGVAYLFKLVNNPRNKNRVCHVKGSIWENCKDIEGTRGVLARQKIEDQIAKWRQDPVTLKARVDGEFIHLAGAVFLLYNASVHVIKPHRIPLDWNIFQIVDIHPAKAAVGVWMALSPMGKWHVIAEYPTDPWDELGNSTKTIKQFGFDFKMIEQGKVKQFWYLDGMPTNIERYGDPNAFACKQQHNKQSFQWQYNEECDLWYDINVDNDIDLRHNKIKELIYYDVTRKLEYPNYPDLLIFDTCPNVQSAFVNYCNNDNGKPEEEWKDWLDCVGYGVVTVEYWENKKSKESIDYEDEYEAIERGRRGVVGPEHASPYGYTHETLELENY